jgi:hypothetical protein
VAAALLADLELPERLADIAVDQEAVEDMVEMISCCRGAVSNDCFIKQGSYPPSLCSR